MREVRFTRWSFPNPELPAALGVPSKPMEIEPPVLRLPRVARWLSFIVRPVLAMTIVWLRPMLHQLVDYLWDQLAGNRENAHRLADEWLTRVEQAVDEALG